MEIIKETIKQTILFKDRTCDVWSEYIENQYLAYQIPGTDKEGIYNVTVETTAKNCIGTSDRTLFGELGWKDSSNKDRTVNTDLIAFNDVVNGDYARKSIHGIYHKGGQKITFITRGEGDTSLGNEEVPGGVSFDCLITVERIS